MDKLSGQKVVVLGATGMVATPVVHALANDNEVWGVARFNNQAAKADLEERGVKTVVLDLAEPDVSVLPTDVDYVVNLAVTHSNKFSTALRSNAESLGLIMHHFRNAKAFLHCSSTGVYAPNGAHQMREEDPLGDNHRAMLPTYSISKIAAESVARLSARLHNLPTIIARLNVPYGDAVAWPSIHLECILAGAPIQVLPGEPSYYSPIHSDDIIRHIPRLLGAAAVPAPTVNWAGPDVVSVQEWCAYIGSLVGKEPIIEETQMALPSVAVDTTFMDQLIGPAEVRWQDGMKRMVASSHPEITLP
ncbi:MAG TPA: NAD(P)-dependent oxidoreductase [Acidimicrobiales bacterium]|jgi:nucleoside-diphosphate-sugar epimerase|nr:NAD(P)-dependent oxidoreductase [Acidimicrobiales bacterium]